MEIIILSFIITVIAFVVGYYLGCKLSKLKII